MTDDRDKKDHAPVVVSTRRSKQERRGSEGPPRRSPRQTHGTQVRFQVECARCGRSDVLSFVPKTLGEMLCRACAEEVFGSDWAHGRPIAGRTEYPFTCAECGAEGTVPFEPDGRRPLLCNACFRGEASADTERLKGKKIVR